MTNTIPNVPRDFTKKPVLIKAIQWSGDNLDAVLLFCAGDASYELMARGNSELVISTLEDGAGTAKHVASLNDWIIRGVKGEFYPCKPDIFDMTYELSAPSPANHVEDVRAMVAAPSPAGVDGLEVIGWYTDDHLDDKSATTYSREVADRWLAKGWPVTGIANAADAKAIIDGLRWEVADLLSMLATVSKAGLRVRTERDQQAQRIGELEGLLRSCLPALSDGGCAALANRIAATLSAGKEGE